MTSAERIKDRRQQRIYKQTLAEFEAKKAAQNNQCEICGRSFDEFIANQDHDHQCCPAKRKDKNKDYCGKCNRGVLCYICNRWVISKIDCGPKWA